MKKMDESYVESIIDHLSERKHDLYHVNTEMSISISREGKEIAAYLWEMEQEGSFNFKKMIRDLGFDNEYSSLEEKLKLLRDIIEYTDLDKLKQTLSDYLYKNKYCESESESDSESDEAANTGIE